MFTPNSSGSDTPTPPEEEPKEETGEASADPSPPEEEEKPEE